MLDRTLSGLTDELKPVHLNPGGDTQELEVDQNRPSKQTNVDFVVVAPPSGLPRQQQGVHRHSGSHGEHGERLLADGVAGGGARHRHDHQTQGEERGNLSGTTAQKPSRDLPPPFLLVNCRH